MLLGPLFKSRHKLLLQEPHHIVVTQISTHHQTVEALFPRAPYVQVLVLRVSTTVAHLPQTYFENPLLTLFRVGAQSQINIH